jgi:hypothetical protein
VQEAGAQLPLVVVFLKLCLNLQVVFRTFLNPMARGAKFLNAQASVFFCLPVVKLY